MSTIWKKVLPCWCVRVPSQSTSWKTKWKSHFFWHVRGLTLGFWALIQKGQSYHRNLFKLLKLAGELEADSHQLWIWGMITDVLPRLGLRRPSNNVWVSWWAVNVSHHLNPTMRAQMAPPHLSSLLNLIKHQASLSRHNWDVCFSVATDCRGGAHSQNKAVKHGIYHSEPCTLGYFCLISS